MKPDRINCQNCSKEIARGKWCSDKCRMANKRVQKLVDSMPKPEHIPKSNINKVEQIVPEQSENEQPEQSDDFRSTLCKTDKTFYDRAMKDFKEPYYKFETELKDSVCILESCGAKFKTSLRMLRFCSYQHYSDALSGRH